MSNALTILSGGAAHGRSPQSEDFARPRIRNGSARAPAASRTMNPVDDVVARVERMNVLGAKFNAERVSISRCFKRLVPPARALEQRAANGFRRARIEVVNDRLYRVGDLRFRIDLRDAMTADEAFLRRRADTYASMSLNVAINASSMYSEK